MQSYIGVTGFMSAGEVEEVLKVVPDGAKRKLMVGVLASVKTLRGEIPNNQAGRYPHPQEVAEIFVDHPAALNLIHFHTRERENLFEQMSAITALGGKNLHGLQLNSNWPDPSTLWEYKRKYPGKILVLQCGKDALASTGHDAKRLAQFTVAYEGACEYLLIDFSDGEGKLFDSRKGLEYLECLNSLVRGMMFGLAGGLCPETLYRFEPIIKAFPDTSSDAEGRLRDNRGRLDVVRAREFFSMSNELSGRYAKK